MKIDRKRMELELRGRTLDVYILLLRSNEPLGVREVQRRLGMSSPSVAQHHLNKLLDLGLIERDRSNRYSATRLIDVSILAHFVKLGSTIIPRGTFYSSFFATFTLLYALIFYPEIDPYALILGTASTAAFVFESMRTWFRRPW